MGLREPFDIAACERTSQLHVADTGFLDFEKYVWRVSADGADAKRWLPKSPSDTIKPHTLSVTSTRLLVTSRDTRQLVQFDADGEEVRRVQLPDDVNPLHAVESPTTATFIVSHEKTPGYRGIQFVQHQVSEINTDGEVLRRFSGSRLSSIGWTPHIAADSHGNVFVADARSHHILVLDARLKLRRCIIDEHQLNYKPPWRLCYREQLGQLLVGCVGGVAVFDVLND